MYNNSRTGAVDSFMGKGIIRNSAHCLLHVAGEMRLGSRDWVNLAVKQSIEENAKSPFCWLWSLVNDREPEVSKVVIRELRKSVLFLCSRFAAPASVFLVCSANLLWDVRRYFPPSAKTLSGYGIKPPRAPSIRMRRASLDKRFGAQIHELDVSSHCLGYGVSDGGRANRSGSSSVRHH